MSTLQITVPRCVSFVEAAKILGISKDSIRRRADEGELPILLAASRGSTPPTLGVRDSVYYYLSWATGEIVPLKPNDHTKNQLKNLAPAEYWSAYYAGEDGKIQWDNAVADLMDACQKAGKFNPDHMRGLGAWLELDPVTRDYRVVVHLGDKLIVGHQQVPLQVYDGKFVYQSQDPLPAPDLSQPLSDEEGQLINDACLALRWENRLSGYLMAGWLMTAMICGALTVRPHVWLTGGAGTGKTWFLSEAFAQALAIARSYGLKAVSGHVPIGNIASERLWLRHGAKSAAARKGQDFTIAL